ncbi:MAG: aspartate kinase [Armatimonadota bacterium]|nr:aspartate kinase [Armatimonadota bacterium]MDR7400755.1 aspartate kinase [Armatimonadota bacterium]MDR7404614.1 aspartate kinase [Armatimonadota bacterium]MDR7436651.1 aspartate kinase [Armatimonadota bacterium]MDR7472930.1 aspartate kinase [Armatimonadota bacterium]
MRIVVQKFGGTVLATPEGRLQVAELITATRTRGYRVVAVVSALGREGDPYATDTLVGLMREVDPQVDPRTLDLLLSTGEIISTALLAHTLVRAGCPAIALTGGQAGILTTDEFNDARILSIDPRPVRRHLEQDRVAVVAGFQGVTATGEITTLGRGGSDTTAVAMGAALGAEVVEIYKDVEGIMTADPKLVPAARPLRTITYDEVSQMAALGARVLHPRAADIGREHNVRLVIRRLGSLNGGTVIVKGPELGVPIIDGRPVVALAHLPDVVQLKIPRQGDRDLSRPLQALDALAAAGISIDLINLLPEVLAFTVKEEVAAQASKVLTTLGFDVQASAPCAKVSIIGAGMRGRPGVMARVVKALHAAGVEILQTADSHTTISCLVWRDQMQAALQALHDEFGLAEDVQSQQESEG